MIIKSPCSSWPAWRLEPEPDPVPGRPATCAEPVSTMTQNDRVSRVVAGVTRLCEPLQQALLRGCLWTSWHPKTKEQARQQLFAVVEQEVGSGEFVPCSENSPRRRSSRGTCPAGV